MAFLSQNPDNLLIGIGRDGFIVLDKITKVAVELYHSLN